MKTKQIFTLAILALFAILTLTGCGKDNSNTTTDNAAAKNEAVFTQTTTVAENDNDADSKTEWKTFLKEYDEWADKYIELYKKYKANPADTSLLSEYTEVVQKATEWSKKSDKYLEELKSASEEELEEYSNTISKIQEKLDKETK
ncbi:MAG: hypothetical protein IJO19_01070 [Clostridia bacterium]|nr:hypothetical protein [Clostridia bacterium]